jgi:hypothetical protein
MEVKNITEKDNLHKQWYIDAKEQTLETLPKFLNHLIEDYIHNYGTICHAISAGAIATAWAIDNSKQGGITGFQAGCVMWKFIEQWMYSNNICGLKVLDYDNMLYPQYYSNFEKNINEDTWIKIQDMAKKLFKEKDCFVHENVVEHWKSIIEGKIPFGYKVLINKS